MNKRVLIYCPVFKPQESGYTHAFEGLIKNLLQAGYCVDVLTKELIPDNIKEPLSLPNLNVIRFLPQLNIWGFGLFYQFYQLAKKIVSLNTQYKYDLIICETGDEPLLFSFLPKSVCNKTIVRFHSTSDTEYLLYGNHKKYKIRKFFWKHLASKKIKHLVATNNYHLAFAESKILNKPKLLTKNILTNTVTPLQQNTNKPSECIQIIMLGRLDKEGYKQKGFACLVKALHIISQKHFKKDFTITLIGNGEKFYFLQEQIAAYPFVKLIPKLNHSEIIQLLLQTDIVILPSLYEGVSMFALEALATSNAVIYSATGGLIEMVEKNGILIEPNNEQQLADAIVSLIHHPDLETLKLESTKIAEKKFSSKVQLQQFEHILKEVTNAK
ncbi:MAG: glycosyltransferase family 4 protein [Bacteroidia bacterium]|nr:glycosyltransferase family 4 protein [Bacteroidia bacterium]